MSAGGENKDTSFKKFCEIISGAEKPETDISRTTRSGKPIGIPPPTNVKKVKKVAKENTTMNDEEKEPNKEQLKQQQQQLQEQQQQLQKQQQLEQQQQL